MGSDDGRLQHALFPLAVLGIIVVALGLHWPSLEAGYRSDDYVQRAMLRGEFPALRSSLDLFDFASGGAAETEQLRDVGYLPWWSVPEIRLRMWRPLSSALIAFDHQVFGDDTRLQHAHSLLWLVLMLIAASALLHHLLGARAAAVALLAVALEEGLVVPVGWLANRSALVATTLGCLAVLAYVRARQGSRTPVLAALLATAAVLVGEYALMTLPYAFAYEWVTQRRLRATWPIALPGLAYIAVRTLLGAGAVGSGYYLSPLAAPLDFLHALLVRVPVLFADAVFGLPAGLLQGAGPVRVWLLEHGLSSYARLSALPEWTSVHVLLGYLAIAAYVALARLSLSLARPEQAPGLRCLAIGAALAMLPATGSLPADRLLVPAALGVSAVFAVLLLAALRQCRRALLPLRQRTGYLALTLAIAYVAFFVSLTRVHARARIFASDAQAMRVWALRAELPSRGVEHAQVYLISSADFTSAANLPYIRHAHGQPLLHTYRRLSPASAPLDLRRRSARVIELVTLTSRPRQDAVPSLYRARSAPLRAGDEARLPGLRIEVLRAFEGNPLSLRFTFDRDVDDDELWFLQATPHGLRRVHMPAVGQSLRLLQPTFRDLRP